MNLSKRSRSWAEAERSREQQRPFKNTDRVNKRNAEIMKALRGPYAIKW